MNKANEHARVVPQIKFRKTYTDFDFALPVEESVDNSVVVEASNANQEGNDSAENRAGSMSSLIWFIKMSPSSSGGSCDDPGNRVVTP